MSQYFQTAIKTYDTCLRYTKGRQIQTEWKMVEILWHSTISRGELFLTISIFIECVSLPFFSF